MLGLPSASRSSFCLTVVHILLLNNTLDYTERLGIDDLSFMSSTNFYFNLPAPFKTLLDATVEELSVFWESRIYHGDPFKKVGAERAAAAQTSQQQAVASTGSCLTSLHIPSCTLMELENFLDITTLCRVQPPSVIVGRLYLQADDDLTALGNTFYRLFSSSSVPYNFTRFSVRSDEFSVSIQIDGPKGGSVAISWGWGPESGPSTILAPLSQFLPRFITSHLSNLALDGPSTEFLAHPLFASHHIEKLILNTLPDILNPSRQNSTVTSLPFPHVRTMHMMYAFRSITEPTPLRDLHSYLLHRSAAGVPQVEKVILENIHEARLKRVPEYLKGVISDLRVLVTTVEVRLWGRLDPLA
ncbi:hypothetical protein DL96DRAFT_1775593 [Flagelloscypha sp. PMI_526]|nr:hypothetical protein DL96DRAFT_1775593 [Flagelloscypha sp. PMI_526]